MNYYISLRQEQYLIHLCVCASCTHTCSVANSCLTLFITMDCSPPGSSVHGILQARILEWVAISSSRGSSRPRDQTCVSCTCCIDRWILHHWVTWEAQCIFQRLINNCLVCLVRKTRGEGENGEEAVSVSGTSLIAGTLDSRHGKEQCASAGWVCAEIPKLSVPAQSLLGANPGLQKEWKRREVEGQGCRGWAASLQAGKAAQGCCQRGVSPSEPQRAAGPACGRGGRSRHPAESETARSPPAKRLRDSVARVQTLGCLALSLCGWRPSAPPTGGQGTARLSQRSCVKPASRASLEGSGWGPAANAGTRAWSPVREDSVEQLSLWTMPTDAHSAQSPRSPAREAASLQPEKAHACNKNPAQPKINE